MPPRSRFFEKAKYNLLFAMAIKEATKPSKKRKNPLEDDAPTLPTIAVGELEMLSDEEDDTGAVSDDGEVDEFPEIDTRSDSDDSDEFEETDDEDGGEELDDDEDDEEDSSDADSLHVFPQAKTIISDITGQLKRVYPEIEPDYDSDSSTEDVSTSVYFPACVAYLKNSGT